MWCMKRTNIYLEERQTAILDRLASEQGVSRAELVRQLLDQALRGQDESLEAGLGAIRDSFGVLRNVQFEALAREDDARARHLAAVWNDEG